MRVVDRLAQSLREAGISTVFGLLGDGNLDQVLAFAAHGGRFVPTLDESGAVSAADGWARTTGQVGVASVTHGPGFTNTLTALTEAVRARSHLLLLTGDTAPVAHHLQRFDLAAAARLAGAEYVRVGADTAGAQIAAAMEQVRAASVPLVLDVPVDIAAAEVMAVADRSDPPAPAVVEPDEAALDTAIGIMATARRPLVLAGRGAVLADAHDELVRLAGLLGAPLATSLLGREYFAGDPFDLGIAGTLSEPAVLDALLSCDCLIAFGASLNRFTTADFALATGRPVIQVDRDPAAFGRYTAPTVAVTGDARQVAAAMSRALEGAELEPSHWRQQAREARIAAAPEDGPRAAAGTLDLRTAMRVLDEALPDDRLVATDTGRFIYTAWRELRVADPRDFVHTLNFASIGLGIATAVGVAAAHPDRMTVAVAGDGGGMMGLGELTTAVRERLPLVVVIADDGSYGMERHHLRRAGLDPEHASTQWPSFAEVARAYGAEGHTVTDADQLRKVLEGLDPLPAGPVLIDVLVDPDAVVAQ
ncbi:thiamine pyrophosphate-binding protein [Aeromicrobium camelliae]|uniref:Thiamine pyrophosphate-binding protein n=1 Tax=Aeromicrobium camelliae TaxID=1538144 RepID=A0A3N6WBI6_9ACTN|nr:thiamine pyrophosphate-binding protein [Aeromicrobium camelliae]RQN02422.1 thiamine pyrophosphate-binding protein [Aeromicrobium camelliae]